MSYHITVETNLGARLPIAEQIPTLAEARNAVKVLFTIPGITIASATIYDSDTGANATWGLSASGDPVHLSSNAAAFETK